MRISTSLIVAVTAGVLTLAVQSPANAKAEQVNFTYQARELTSEGNVQHLANRLRDFARSTCGGSAMTPFAIQRKCQNEIVEQIVTQISDPRLTATFKIGPRYLARDGKLANR